MSQTPQMFLEVVVLPVADVDRAKTFYAEKLGFVVDHDAEPANGMRIVQLTPPGSACSIVIGSGMPEMTNVAPGSYTGMHLVVADVPALVEMLRERGVDAGELTDYGGGMIMSSFRDPDGNGWVLQQFQGSTADKARAS